MVFIKQKLHYVTCYFGYVFFIHFEIKAKSFSKHSKFPFFVLNAIHKPDISDARALFQ